MHARWLLVTSLAAVAACEPFTPGPAVTYVAPAQRVQPYDLDAPPPSGSLPSSPVSAGPAEPDRVVQSTSDFIFDGGRIDFELHQAGSRVTQVARNRYMVPVVMSWEISGLHNLDGVTALHGVVILPPAPRPDTQGPAVELAQLAIADPHESWNRHIQFKARFGDPQARPQPFEYALPFHGTFTVIQGFHGAFSHRGSNEFAVDFDCPVATTVRAARPGIVVVTYDGAQGSGTTPEYLDYSRVNFVLVLHDDGTLGEYLHLSPSGVEVQPGQRVERGQALALSGNTGFSTTPHLHFQVMTAADDGIAARSFPFQFEVSQNRDEEPVQGRSYASWE